LVSILIVYPRQSATSEASPRTGKSWPSRSPAENDRCRDRSRVVEYANDNGDDNGDLTRLRALGSINPGDITAMPDLSSLYDIVPTTRAPRQRPDDGVPGGVF
jgi:hypothetical protein